MPAGPANRLPNGLTPKQTQFVQKIISNVAEHGDLKATSAALDVYNTTDPHVARSIANENLLKPGIKDALNKALSSAGLTHELLTGELAKITKTEVKVITGDTKLRAIIESLKLLGAYPNDKQPFSGHSTVINIQQISYGDAKERLKTLHSESLSFMDDAG